MKMNKLQFCLLLLFLLPFYVSAQSTHYDPLKAVDPGFSPGDAQPATDPLQTFDDLTRRDGEKETDQTTAGLEYAKNYDAAKLFIEEVQVPEEALSETEMLAPLAKSPHISVDTLATLPGHEPLPND
jgi:hypothetical protein